MEYCVQLTEFTLTTDRVVRATTDRVMHTTDGVVRSTTDRVVHTTDRVNV